MKTKPKLLEDLPRIVLCHIMSFLQHFALLNLALCSHKLHNLVMREWHNNPNLWRQITLSPTLSQRGFLSLNNALIGKKMNLRHIKIIKIHKSSSSVFLSDRVCKFITTLHKVSRIIIQSNITNKQVVQILNGFNNHMDCELCKIYGYSLNYVEMTKLNFVANKIRYQEEWRPI